MGAEQFEVGKGLFHGSWCLHINLVDITGAGDVVTNMAPGFAGRIKKVYFVTGSPVTTGAKLFNATVEINAVALVGGIIALTSAAVDPLGKVIAGSAITGANSFDKDDTISVVADTVTAFAEGDGTLVIEYEGKVL